MSDRRDDATCVDSLEAAQRALAIQFEVKLDAQVWFGAEADSWTHEERCKRLVGVFDDAWRAQGGDGEHPASERYRGLSGVTR